MAVEGDRLALASNKQLWVLNTRGYLKLDNAGNRPITADDAGKVLAILLAEKDATDGA